MDLAFQRFEEELEGLPGEYAPPSGELWLARQGRRVIGVVALRSLGGRRGELKRLYVAPRARGRGLGRRLTRQVARHARAHGLRWLYLDTLASMTAARQLYESMGFERTRPYRYNPIRGSRFLRLRLDPTPARSLPRRRRRSPSRRR